MDYSSDEYIIATTMKNLVNFLEKKRGWKLSAEAQQEIESFLREKNVSSGVHFYASYELPNVEKQFLAEVYNVGGYTEEREFWLSWSDEPKLGYRDSLMGISIRKTNRQTFKNYCTRRGIVMVDEMLKVVNCDEAIQIWVCNMPCDFFRFIQIVAFDYDKTGFYLGEEPKNEVFDFEKENAFYCPDNKKIIIYNPLAIKSLEVFSYDPIKRNNL